MFRLHTVCCMHALWYAATLYVYSFYTMIDLFMLSSLHHIFMLRPWLPFLISEWLHRSAALPAAPCCGRRATFPWQTAAPRRRRPQQRRPRHLGENGKNQGFWNWNQRKDGKVKQNNFAWLFCVLICFFDHWISLYLQSTIIFCSFCFSAVLTDKWSNSRVCCKSATSFCFLPWSISQVAIHHFRGHSMAQWIPTYLHI